jgi:hypothetical protein
MAADVLVREASFPSGHFTFFICCSSLAFFSIA